MKNKKAKRDLMSASGIRAVGGIVTVALLASVLSIGCEAQTADPTGGETHFLKVCDPNSDVCGEGLSCICGVCTTACSVSDPCSDFAGAQCVAPPPTCQLVERACDVHCSANEECFGLSSNHFCIDGWCRLASATVVQPTSDGGSPGMEPQSMCESSGLNGNDVVVIGDSFFATNHEVTAQLEAVARGAEVLSDVERYRDYSHLTSNSLVVSGSGILDQYRLARDDAEVSVVIMNGGGADVLIGICDPVDEQCPAIADAVAALENIFAEMAADGVRDVVFVSYPDPQVPEVLEKMDVIRPMLEAACASSEVPCTFVELQARFAGNEAAFIAEDGLNPTSAGAEAAAAAIWEAMVASCIAQ